MHLVFLQAATHHRNRCRLLPPFLCLSPARSTSERSVCTYSDPCSFLSRIPSCRLAVLETFVGSQIIATACLFLAGKVEETPKPLNEVVRVSYLIQHKDEYEMALKSIQQKVRMVLLPCVASQLHHNNCDTLADVGVSRGATRKCPPSGTKFTTHSRVRL